MNPRFSIASPTDRDISHRTVFETPLASNRWSSLSVSASHHDISNMTLELVFDFDGTITEDDSIAWVLDAALSYHKANSSPETYHSLANSWRRVVESYEADLDAYHRCFCPATQADDSTPLDVARNHFSNDQRRQIERASLSRVQDAGLFCGVPLEYLFQSGHKHREQGTIKLRRGFPDLVHLIRSHSVRTSFPAGHYSRHVS